MGDALVNGVKDNNICYTPCMGSANFRREVGISKNSLIAIGEKVSLNVLEINVATIYKFC